MAVRAPEFRPELDWINTGGHVLSLADFRGRILILDFWTYGCINCIHMIPELVEVGRRFPEEVVVVGVHSGKFINERVTEEYRPRLRAARRRASGAQRPPVPHLARVRGQRLAPTGRGLF